jgi:hypothetical protein
MSLGRSGHRGLGLLEHDKLMIAGVLPAVGEDLAGVDDAETHREFLEDFFKET